MKGRIIVLFLVAVLLVMTSASIQNSAVNDSDEVEVVTEALNGYFLDHMSWGVKAMGLDKLQQIFENSGASLPEVRVAVIDSGINTSNRYIQGRYTDDGYNFLNNNTDIEDEQTHGTMVGGIIADGTSSNVKILPIKVNDKNGRGTLKNVAKGIFYAIEHNADVINLSLSAADPNRTLNDLDEAIDAAVKKGIVVVTAAGNQQSDASFRYPANKENVITVTAVDRNNVIGDNVNTGDPIDFALPGVFVTAPYKSLFFVDSGTSLAAPHASAAAALLKTWDKSLTQDEIVTILKDYSVDLGEEGFDTTYGWGMIDLGNFDLNTRIERLPFVDVPESAWYREPTKWAYFNGYTSGIDETHFAPNLEVTRAQVVQFLYAASGKPIVETKSAFNDVKGDAWYADAVAWAVDNGITAGTSADTFSPDMLCTREQTVTFLYALADRPDFDGGESFIDVMPKAWYAKSVAWASKNKIVSGVGEGRFGTGKICTRAQLVTMLFASRDVLLIAD